MPPLYNSEGKMAIKVQQRISERFSLSAFGSGSEADTTTTVNADAVAAEVTIRPNVPQCRSSLVSSCSSSFTTSKTSFQFLSSSFPFSSTNVSNIFFFCFPSMPSVICQNTRSGPLEHKAPPPPPPPDTTL